ASHTGGGRALRGAARHDPRPHRRAGRGGGSRLARGAGGVARAVARGRRATGPPRPVAARAGAGLGGWVLRRAAAARAGHGRARGRLRGQGSRGGGKPPGGTAGGEGEAVSRPVGGVEAIATDVAAGRATALE